MATVSSASTHWEGTLFEGSGTTSLDTSGVATFDVNWGARAESGSGTTNPEELLAAAQATCFSMALSNGLAKNGTPATSIDTSADVTFVPGTGITAIVVKVAAVVPGVTSDEFDAFAADTHVNCPVSQALKAVPSTLEVTSFSAA